MPTSPISAITSSAGASCRFKATGESDYRDLGNAPEVELTPKPQTLKRYSSRRIPITKTCIAAGDGWKWYLPRASQLLLPWSVVVGNEPVSRLPAPAH